MTSAFRPVPPDSPGFPMPPTVPAGLRLRLSRAPLREGAEIGLTEWMSMLTVRYDECLEILPAERAVFEAIFRSTEADGSVWIHHLSLMGAHGAELDETHPVDASHADFSRRLKQPGWEQLEPLFMLTPAHLSAAMAAWGETGTA